MKKFYLTLLLGFLFLASPSPLKAQSFERSYQDYIFNRTVYDDSFSDYQDVKNAYMVNPTLRLKDEAKQKAYAMLINRDNLTITHLAALKTKIIETTGLETGDKDDILGKIDAESLWYTTHKNAYTSGDALETLFDKSDESQERYKNNTHLVVNEALFNISLGEVRGIRLSHEEIYTTLKKVINDGVADGKLTLSPFNHWFTDIDATDQILSQNEDDARTEIQKIHSQSFSTDSSYNNAINILTASIGPLTQLNRFLSEILAYIVNQQ